DVCSSDLIVRGLYRAVWRLFLTAAIAAACAVTIVSWNNVQRQLTPPANRPIAVQTSNYVTSASCRACHPGNYASWHASFHRTMTQVATAQTVMGGAPNLELTFNGRQYKMERTGGKFFVRSRRSGEEQYGSPREVV